MGDRRASSQSDTATARLLIHADAAGHSGVPDSPMHRLRARYGGFARRSAPPPLALNVMDLAGRPLASIQSAGRLTELRLPAGTCVVRAIAGTVHRGYTLTLESGRSFDLHLQLWPEWP